MVAARDLAPVKTPACENGRLSPWTFQKDEILTVLCTIKSGIKRERKRLPNSSVCVMKHAHEMDGDRRAEITKTAKQREAKINRRTLIETLEHDPEDSKFAVC